MSARPFRVALATLAALCLPATAQEPPTLLPSPTPLPVSAPGPPPLRLADALARSQANVRVVQADVAVRTAGVARLEALKAFVPLVNLPYLAVAFRRFTGPSTDNFELVFPDVTGGTPLVGRPGLDHASLYRTNLFFPLDPSGHITALPIAEEGVRAKEVMEQLVRRTEAVVAAQRYFEAKQVDHGVRAAVEAAEVARLALERAERRLAQRQIEDVDVSQARVDHKKALVLLTDTQKAASISRRRLGVVLHQSRLLSPQDAGPVPIEPECNFAFDLDDPDTVRLEVVPDFPTCREDAIRRAKRQRYEVRLLEVGLRIARLTERRDKLRFLGLGRLPLSLSFKNTTPGNGGLALGAIFGSTYDLPLLDVGLWANLKRARLDVVVSQLELEKTLLEVAEDAGSSWDRWEQAGREWDLREAEVRLRREYYERAGRLYEQGQAIALEVAAARAALAQADAIRYTAWYNLQLARLDILRATELLLDYAEKSGAVPPADAVAGARP